MSDWFKAEKSVPRDIRTLRIARALRHSDKSLTEASSITLAWGCLMQLWSYADEHIADDNTLSVSLDDIDEIVGVKGFAQAVPADWLKVLDADRVELPDFIEHNGTTAKRRAQAAARQAKHRWKERNKEVTRDNVTGDDARREEKRRDKKKPPIPPFDPSTIPGLDLEAWQRWVDYRAKRKPAIKPISMAAAARELAFYGPLQAAVVQHSMANQYQGLFAPKTNGNGIHLDPEASAIYDALVANNGAMPDGSPRTPRVQAALEAIGGWSAIRMRGEYDAPRLRKSFCEAYRSAK